MELATASAQVQHDVEPLILAIERALERKTKDEVQPTVPAAQVVTPRALRVDMDRIDALVKLTGELIVVKQALGHAA